MKGIQFQVEGDDAEALAKSLSAFIKNEWQIDVSPKPIKHQTNVDDKVELGTVLGVISVLIGIPGFLESKMVTTRRLEAKKKFDQLQAWFKQQPAEITKNAQISIEIDRKKFKLQRDLSHLDEMLDVLEDAQSTDSTGVSE